jgi:hypothetical protein
MRNNPFYNRIYKKIHAKANCISIAKASIAPGFSRGNERNAKTIIARKMLKHLLLLNSEQIFTKKRQECFDLSIFIYLWCINRTLIPLI